jgi:hypothetical protein
MVGGDFRGGRLRRTSVVAAAIDAMAAANAGCASPAGVVTPVILRTYCLAAATISSDVAGGSRPRSGVMFRHMP